MSSNTYITSVFLLLVFQTQFVVKAHSSAILPFFVAPDDDNAAVVHTTLSSSGEPVTCEFTYHTLNKKSSLEGRLQNSQRNQKPHQRSIQKDPSAILGKISGVCIPKSMDYWKYEVCFESKVTQSHGRATNNLGVYVRMDGNVQVYEDGDSCEALSGRVGRTSRVEFVCDKNLRLLSIEEISTCNYRLIVSTPIVCGHSEFSQASSVVTQDKKGPESQSWFLELAELDGHQVSCTVSTESESPVHFERFELTMYSSSMELLPEMHVCRRRGRIDLELQEKQYILQHTDSNTRVTLTNGQNFQGNLDYAYVQAVPHVDSNY